MVWLILVISGGAVSMMVWPALEKKLQVEKVGETWLGFIVMAMFAGAAVIFWSVTGLGGPPVWLGIGLFVIGWSLWKWRVSRAESDPKP